MFRSINGGGSFAQVDVGGSSLYVSDVLVDPQDSSFVYQSRSGFSGVAGQNVRRSTDGGDTWQVSGNGIPDIPVNALEFDSTSSQILWAGTDIGAYRSTDQGGHLDSGWKWDASGGDLRPQSECSLWVFGRLHPWSRGIFSLHRLGTNSDPDFDPNHYPDSNDHSDSIEYAHFHQYADFHRYAHLYADVDRYSNFHRDFDVHCNGHEYRDVDFHCHINPERHFHRNRDGYDGAQSHYHFNTIADPGFSGDFQRSHLALVPRAVAPLVGGLFPEK